MPYEMNCAAGGGRESPGPSPATPWRLDGAAARVLTLGELALAVANGLENELAVVRACADALLGCDELEEDANAAVQDLSIATARAVALARALIDFARGSGPADELVDLQELLGETAALLQRTSGGQIDVLLDRRAHAPCVTGKRADLANAFLSLGLNARDAMPGGGAILISTRTVNLGEGAELPPGWYVRVSITDHGTGIPKDHLARVFDPFFTTKPGGTGLGLSIVRDVLERHRGAVEVASDVEAGTTVTVTLPLAGGGQPHDEE
jgi:signal transduction histidine kinase